LHATLQDAAEHEFRINKILRAAEADHANFGPAGKVRCFDACFHFEVEKSNVERPNANLFASVLSRG
jgi:hypothetical protein